MNNVVNVFQAKTPWPICVVMLGMLGLSGCADMKTFMSTWAMPHPAQAEAPDVVLPDPHTPPPPTVAEVEAAIATTKGLLDDQQEQMKEVLALKAEVKQELREIKEHDLTTMRNAVEELQHQVEGWETTVSGNHGAISSQVNVLTQELHQAQDRLVAYGGQVPALADQIDQNYQEHATLFAAFQASLVGFKAAMGELQNGLGDERQRASQEEMALSTQLTAQQQSLERVGGHATDILALHKRLNQLHIYMNSVRDSVASETTALRVSLQSGATDHLQDVVTALDQRYHDSEQRHADIVTALEKKIQALSAGFSTLTQSMSRMEAGTVPTASIHTTTSSPRPKKK